MGDEGTCVVCKGAANLRCTGCMISCYCSSEHQKADWINHKCVCICWSIQESSTLGKYLIATRDLEKDNLIVSESPIVFGPVAHADQRICVGCGESTISVRCPGCSWYACRISCEGLVDDNRHGVECKLLAAARVLPRGEHLSTTYTHVLWATRARREHLLATKYFSCYCERCKDPTELGSHLGTLKCPCGAGIILPKNPLDLETEWSCDICPGLLTSHEVFELTERLGEEVESAMATGKQETLTSLYSRLLVLLHPGHQYCIAVGHSLMQLLRFDDPRKAEICKRILKTTSILDPFGGRLGLYTAVALRELSLCPGEELSTHLPRAIELLRHEPDGSPGENLRKLIQSELCEGENIVFL